MPAINILIEIKTQQWALGHPPKMKKANKQAATMPSLSESFWPGYRC